MKPKEQAIKDFREMIRISWTRQRFTEREKENLDSMLLWVEQAERLTGNYNQRWEQLNNLYNAFLYALDYKALGWRESITA